MWLFQIRFKKRRNFYTIKTTDVGRPDLVSFNIYGKMNYWWVIMKLNGIEDVFNDMSEGQVLMIPSESDIQDFYLETNRTKK